MAGITTESSLATVFGRSAKKRKAVEEGLGLRTVGDLLHHFPRRYVETKDVSTVERPLPGEHLTVVGDVVSSKVSAFTRGNRRQYRTEVRIRTHGPDFSVTFFSPYAQQAEGYTAEFSPGSRGVFTGQVKQFGGRWQLEKAHGQRIDADGGALMSKLIPVYPLTAGLYSWDLQKVIGTTLDLVEELPDVFDAELREAYELVDVRQALRWIHAPDEWSQVGAAQKRFRFAEALVLQLVLARRRAELRARGSQARAGRVDGLLSAFDARLPFTLTDGQRRVGEQIAADLAQPHPMNRLLQGEVGSGKTLVAVRAMLHAVDSGGQAALLAPTEVLAAQHHRSISAMMGDLALGGMLGAPAEATRVALLTGSTPKAVREEVLAAVAAGE
ncbi:MAG: DEAD/DEAH box helicase, partial [Nocardioides sp.]|uniref:DEAD/DEAH box helicase n=1 Tax=Nocardioides sp. TaxID=35761 RepID=UPI003F070005